MGFLVAVAYLSTGTASGVEAYQLTWERALGVFGVHLVLLGMLCWRSGVVPRRIGGLVGLAGAAYAADDLGAWVSTSYDLDLAACLFVGEPVLMVWLGWWSVRGGRAASRRSRTAAEVSP